MIFLSFYLLYTSFRQYARNKIAIYLSISIIKRRTNLKVHPIWSNHYLHIEHPALQYSVFSITYDGIQAISNSKIRNFFLSPETFVTPLWVMAWWYRALGTLRTQIWALWRPGKPKTDFDQVQIEEFSKTHF